MKPVWLLFLLVSGLLALCNDALALTPVDLSAESTLPIGTHIAYLQEKAGPIDLREAEAAFKAGRFHPEYRSAMNFGIGAPPTWLAFQVSNTSSEDLPRHITVNTSWIDLIDFYFLSPRKDLVHQRLGDQLLFDQRPVTSRYLDTTYAFAPGITTVFMRVQTPDPMSLPVEIRTDKQDATETTLEAYTYGVVYGALVALLAYNFILFLRLKIWRYAFYSLYLSSFIVANLSYTGHGYWWLWPQNPAWQQWANPVLMVVYGACALIFAMSFLDTPRHLPRLHRFVVASVALPVAVETWAGLWGDRVTGLLLAFTFILYFSLLMVVLGLVSWRAGLTYAKYFLIAALAGVIGASVTAVTVWGLVPYTEWGYRAAEIGTMFEAVLLALALADQFRVSVEQKNRAEQLARIDPLTGLNNRRGFNELATSVWNAGIRNQRHISVIMLDLDHFKQLNDTYGHSAGDRMLKLISEELRHTARAGDILARWGGEEFVLFLPETALKDAIYVANRLRTNIKSKSLVDNGHTLTLTASFGVSHRQFGNVDLETLIQAADRQLYVAKQTGRNRVCSIDTDVQGEQSEPDKIVLG
ncbi:sensor domain-containing diguanylate cyclase [Mangrovitalea sediminis]|uniref:sensor domain-containing diguanylate cyclase n=1 Tax=Mangrovitalea sediminis TaxID=1982043 RepID=UPI000BE4F4B5|nr:diguanylate cyclase [Mangrovitalea sediminis]